MMKSNFLKHNAISVKCGADTLLCTVEGKWVSVRAIHKKMMITNVMVKMVDQNISVVAIFPTAIYFAD